MRKKVIFGIIVFLSILFGIYPISYGLIEPENNEFFATKATNVTSDSTWLFVFTIHIIASAISLLFGWVQFLQKFRIKRPVTHRHIGRIYFIGILIGGSTGLYLSFYANSILGKLGFMTLSILWLFTTCYAIYHIRSKRIEEHAKWAIRSYALTLAAITFRIMLGLLGRTLFEYETAYTICTWISWMINLFIAERIIKNYLIV